MVVIEPEFSILFFVAGIKWGRFWDKSFWGWDEFFIMEGAFDIVHCEDKEGGVFL